MFNLSKEDNNNQKRNSEIRGLFLLAIILIICFFIYLLVNTKIEYIYRGKMLIASKDDVVICRFLSIMAYLGCTIYYIGNEKDEYFIISLIYLNLLSSIIFEKMFSGEGCIIINTIFRVSILILTLNINHIKRLLTVKGKIIISALTVILSLINITIERSILNRYRASDNINLLISIIILVIVFSFIVVIFFTKNAIKNLEVIYFYVIGSISLLIARGFVVIYELFYVVSEHNIHLLRIYINLTKFSFLFIVCGVFLQVFIKTRENVLLSSELKVFYQLAEFNCSEEIVLFDSNGKLYYANKKLRDLRSKSNDIENQYEDIRNIIKKENYNVSKLCDALEENETVNTVIEINRLDKIFEVYGQKVATTNINSYYVFKFNDITEDYRKNEETKNNEEILSEIINYTQDMVIALDDEGNIIYLNLEAQKCLGNIDFKRKKIKYDSLISDEKEREAIQTKLSEKIRYTLNIDNNKTIEVESIIEKVNGLEFSKVNKVILAKNLSESNKYDNLLLEYDNFKEHERIKNNFFINLSHEFKTPLNVIFSAIQLLENVDTYDEKQLINLYNKYKKPMKINCLRMSRTINNMIDILRLDCKDVEVELRDINIVELVEDIVMYINNYFNNTNIIFDTEFEEKIISCDPNKIVRIITNILSNAIKFNGDNSNIYVNIKYEDFMVVIECIDNGIGISKEMCENIFEPFLQIDNSLRRENEGSGMGLSIAKDLIELHNGSISVDSKLGQGSIFRIMLPDAYSTNSINKESDIYIIDSKEIDTELSDIYNLY